MTKSSEGGVVYLDAKQSQKAAEHIMRAMEVMRQEMDDCPFLSQRISCAEAIAELAKSLRACNALFWRNDDEEVKE